MSNYYIHVFFSLKQINFIFLITFCQFFNHFQNKFFGCDDSFE